MVQEAVKGGKLFPANSIIMATTATIGEHALLTADSLANQQFTFLTRKVNRLDDIDPKFVFYYCFELAKWCKENSGGGGAFQSVHMDGFRKFLFPIPPLPVQQAIVQLLDQFDTLEKDMSAGLPAEIAARRKQYEYYREQLLTFEQSPQVEETDG
jgi:type I restriction enzyme S subunit